jgi:phage portal protein BeeE
MASGAAVLTTTYGSPDKEAILPQWAAWAQQAHASSSIVFTALLTRLSLFCEAEFKFQAKDDKHLFGNTSLAKLEEPFGPGSTTGELLARMQQDRSLAGNAYIWDAPGEDRLIRLRPDWTTIISEVVQVSGGGHYRQKIGYWWEPPKSVLGQGTGFFIPADEVVHWAPQPDPQADFRGMSWLTPIYRDVQGDDGMTQYKIKYLDNAASPNMLLRYTQKLNPGTIDAIREKVSARYAGPQNAFKTLVLDQGADATVIGNSLSQMDFSNVAQAGVERILAAAFVPGVLVGLEPLRGAGRGYQESMQKFANMFGRPEWRSVCGALEPVVAPPAGNRLWFDTSGIAALQDGEMERGQTTLVKSQSVLALNQALKYEPQSIVTAVDSGDLTQLKLLPDPPPAAPGGQPVQHLLGQTPPGVVASPLPPSNPRLAIGPASAGDGGNSTTPIARPTAARRFNGNGKDGG